MYMEDFSEHLKQYFLTSFGNCRTNKSGTEIIMPCKFCERETGKPDKGRHLYISLKPPFMYHCFKNPEHSGILSGKIIQELSSIEGHQSNDVIILEELDSQNKAYIRSQDNRIRQVIRYGVSLPSIQDTANNRRKLTYLNARLGLQLDYQNLVNNKILMSVRDIYRYNRIEFQDSPYLQTLDQYYIGFMCHTGVMVNLRRVDDGTAQPEMIKKLRYVNQALLNNIPRDAVHYYILPSVVDTLKPVKVHIAEGPFDILSIRYNLRTNPDNEVFMAILGNTYLNAVKYFLSLIGLVMVEFHIYQDNNIKPYEMYELKSIISPICKIAIHQNTFPGEKDFGVPLSRIQEYVY